MRSAAWSHSTGEIQIENSAGCREIVDVASHPHRRDSAAPVPQRVSGIGEGTEIEDLQVTSSCWVTCFEETAGAKKSDANMAGNRLSMLRYFSCNRHA